MDATRTDPGHTGTGSAGLPGKRPGFGESLPAALSLKWSALHEAAAAVAALAGVPREPLRPEVRHFPATMRQSGGWRREMAEQGIEDLSAMMEPGLSALLSAQARGAEPVAAAKALLDEFLRARDALLELVPPPER